MNQHGSGLFHCKLTNIKIVYIVQNGHFFQTFQYENLRKMYCLTFPLTNTPRADVRGIRMSKQSLNVNQNPQMEIKDMKQSQAPTCPPATNIVLFQYNIFHMI